MAEGYRIGVDIGGTFTDCVVMTNEGELTVAKSPTTPHDRSEGFFSSLDRAAEKLGISCEALLGGCDHLVHGTTTGTNALVSRQGATVGLLATAGHPDVMHLMAGTGRTAGLSPDEALDIPATDKPVPMVPKRLVAEVTERIDSDGDVVVELDEQSARSAIGALLEEGAEAIAISFLWSIKSPRHEHRVKEIVQEISPGIFVTCGADLTAHVGEYERTATTVMNAYIGPLMVRYIQAIEDGARARGYHGAVHFAQCAGGAITVEEALVAPIRTVQSGPVAGTLSTELLGRALDEPNLIAADMGGTTFDVSVIHKGVPVQRNAANIQRYDLALPMLDVESIGAGGGSVAWIDESGRLNVGPKSAGAVPGPACYGRGGTSATVTDADVVLGIIDPDTFLGGRMKLDVEAAQRAIRSIGDQLGLGLLETAAGINRIVDAKMADLIRRKSLLSGFDPRQFTLCAFGGGAALHAGAVGREIGIPRIIVPMPEVAPVWSALGATLCDITHIYQSPDVMTLPVEPGDFLASCRALANRARDDLGSEGFAGDRIALQPAVRMKYTMQVHDVAVPLPAGDLREADVSSIAEEFDRVYTELFGEGAGYAPGGRQITGFELRATGLTDKPDFLREKPSLPRQPSLYRSVYWSEEQASVETPVWLLGDGIPESRIEGPALIESPDTVVAVRPSQTAEFDGAGNVLIDLGLLPA